MTDDVNHNALYTAFLMSKMEQATELGHSRSVTMYSALVHLAVGLLINLLCTFFLYWNSKALRSLRAYPMALRGLREAKQLDGFGKRVMKELTLFMEVLSPLVVEQRYPESDEKAFAPQKKRKRKKVQVDAPAPAAVVRAAAPPAPAPAPVPDAAMVAQLEALGFPRADCEKSVLATGNVSAAIEYLFAHVGDAAPAAAGVAPPAAAAAAVAPPARKRGRKVPAAVRVGEEVPLRGKVTVHLVLDNREVFNKKKRAHHGTRYDNVLKLFGTPFQEKTLTLGDFAWIAVDEHGTELVCSHVIEKKNACDLRSSLMDGRYREQAFRLHKSDATTVVFLMEGHINQNTTGPSPFYRKPKQRGLPSVQAVETAFWSTGYGSNNFMLHKTAKEFDTAVYLAEYTQMLQSMVNSPELRSSAVLNYDLATWNSRNEKTKNLSVGGIWAQQLMAFKGVSEKVAVSILKKYPTARSLIEAYDACETSGEKKTLLQDLKATENSRRVGPALSERLYYYFK